MWPKLTINNHEDLVDLVDWVGGHPQMREGDGLTWLMRWYAEQCDGDWEHSFGVSIGTLDNPGWTVSIDLEGTPLSDRPFVGVSHGVAPGDFSDWRASGSWWVCRVRDRCFDASCGPLDLDAVVNVFRAWASAP